MTRLDVALVERGLVASRSRAADLIKRGLVSVNGVSAIDASRKISDEDSLEVPTGAGQRVSRAGEKLDALLRRYGLSVAGEALDIGASTGGFTQVLLAAGADRVVALDVGHDQLHPTLRADSRVTELSGVNFRDVTAESLSHSLGRAPSFEWVTVDVSFISLVQILPGIRLVAPRANVAVLIKPQFEVGREGLDRRGVVRSLALRNGAVRSVIACAKSLGYEVRGFMPTPLRGERGNQEFMLWIAPEGLRYPQQ